MNEKLNWQGTLVAIQPRILGADVTEREKKLILGENLARLLAPMLAAKGAGP